MKTIAVLGAGTMGAGIAQAAAQGGFHVIMRDLQMSIVRRGIESIERSLELEASRGLITEGEREAILSRITGVTELSEIKEADMVIEAIIENLAIKKQVFTELDNLCPKETILATNTSSLSISEIASVTSRPHKVIGMHFFYPVAGNPIVEVIKGMETSEETTRTTLEVVKKMGKESVLVEKDTPGFVVNRILLAMLNEAICVLGEGVAKAEEIDKAMRLRIGMEQGPLEIADSIGLDSVYSMLLVLLNEFRDAKYRPHPLFSTLVRAGRLGQKTKKGFYDYD